MKTVEEVKEYVNKRIERLEMHKKNDSLTFIGEWRLTQLKQILDFINSGDSND